MNNTEKSEKRTVLDEFNQISNLLAVPTEGNPLPDNRKWTLPCPDEKALADHPAGPFDKEVKECLDSVQKIARSGCEKQEQKEVKGV